MTRAENPLQIYQGERIGRQRYSRAPIEGLQAEVLMEPGAEVTVHQRKLGKIVRKARRMAFARRRIDFWGEVYRKNGNELIEFGNTHDGFRGIGNLNERREDAILIPTRKNTSYNADLLRESLGEERFKQLFTEQIQVSIDTSAGVTQKDIAKTLSRSLSRRGVSRAEQLLLLDVGTVVKPKDSTALFKAIDSGRVKLLPGAIEFDVDLEYRIQEAKREELPPKN
jgi:hypothetical protein